VKPETDLYDVAVIGSGPGGYVAAIMGSQLGLRTALIEKNDKFGGTCLHWGCIPTKALLETADRYQNILDGKKFGIDCPDVSLDFKMVRARKDRLVKKLSLGTAFLMEKNRIDTFHGKGMLAAPGTVLVEGDTFREIRATNIILATGSEAASLPGVEVDGRVILTNREILELESIPESLLIVGAGSVGLEFATIFSCFGSRVTVVEKLPHVLPAEDEEISKEVEKFLKKRGIKCMTGIRLEALDVREGSVSAHVVTEPGKRETLTAEKALIAVGRRPSTVDIGLERLNVTRATGGYIAIDKYMRTSAQGVYAVGDVVPTPALAHLASHEGMLAVKHIAGAAAVPINYDHVPACTFCRPEVASVGLTEKEAYERGFDVSAAKFPFAAVSKASILGENEGFIKMVSERKSGRILGIHMVGPHVTELISEATAMLGLEATAADVSHMIHPHPTLSEGIMEAAHALYNGASIHG
jgi:dihydrolipoamide dehydrogenase